MTKFYACLLFIFVFALSPTAARAVCTLPDGDHGDMLYNLDHTVMQYCNGTKWISMDASKSGGSDNLGNHTATKDLDMTAHKIINASVPTSSADVTNKAYVDAAVASAAGSGGGGGGGTTCMYFSAANNPACPAGWSQAGADQSYFPATSLPHRVCCMGGGSLLDEMPSAFDFPRSPPIAGTAGHTWSPLEITGFDSTNVTITSSANSGLAEFRICADSACSNVLKNWRSTPAGIASGNYLQIRIGAHSTTRALYPKITITVGGMTDDAPITPDFFLAFTTNATFTGSLGGVSGADAKCQSIAEAAGHPGTFRAYIASDDTNKPTSRFENKGTAQAFYTTNLSKIADNWADLTDGSLDLTLYTENGTAVSGTEYVWTGLYNSGTASAPSQACSAWSVDTGNGYYGRNDFYHTEQWVSYSYRGCSNNHHLYCFQTVLPN